MLDHNSASASSVRPLIFLCSINVLNICRIVFLHVVFFFLARLMWISVFIDCSAHHSTATISIVVIALLCSSGDSLTADDDNDEKLAERSPSLSRIHFSYGRCVFALCGNDFSSLQHHLLESEAERIMSENLHMLRPSSLTCKSRFAANYVNFVKI
jgi:hypothetical protein